MKPWHWIAIIGGGVGLWWYLRKKKEAEGTPAQAPATTTRGRMQRAHDEAVRKMTEAAKKTAQGG